MLISLEGKVLGQKKPIFSNWTMELPPSPAGGGDRLRLRDLITSTVTREVQAFRERQEKRKLALIMTPAEIEQGLAKGKVGPYERDFQQQVDTDQAIAAALQAFEDGIYYVFVDKVQYMNLDDEVILKPGSNVVFLRLVALAGG